MKNNIPLFLREKLNLIGFPPIKRFPSEIKQFMLDYALCYDWNITKLNLIFKLMKLEISELEVCEYKGCNSKKRILWDGSISIGCCKNHTSQVTNLERFGCSWNIRSVNNIEKTKITNMDKYGVDNPLKSKIIQEQIRQTNLEKYGVENVSHSQEILIKKEKNNYRKYGVKHTLLVEEIQKQIKQTNLEKYGFENVFSSPRIKEKIATTNLLKYGSTNYFSSLNFKNDYLIIKNKIKSTNLKKYGYEYHSQSEISKIQTKRNNYIKYGCSHPMQIPEILEKQQNNMFSRKEYIWETGEISILQGYEPIVLQELEYNGYNYNSVKTKSKDMPEIYYSFENIKHRYYPDFYIPSENLIIEVKSQWTLNLHREKNELKFQAVKDLGFNFKLEVR